MTAIEKRLQALEVQTAGWSGSEAEIHAATMAKLRDLGLPTNAEEAAAMGYESAAVCAAEYFGFASSGEFLAYLKQKAGEK